MHESKDITWHISKVSIEDRAILQRQNAVTIWLTGLSASGKSTLAYELERRLHDLGHANFVLDGDNIRRGLSSDLGFSPENRKENIPRVAEVARLFNDAGVVLITAFISPYREDRAVARSILGPERFIEVYLAADLSVCERRDPRGLYGKAGPVRLPVSPGSLRHTKRPRTRQSGSIRVCSRSSRASRSFSRRSCRACATAMQHDDALEVPWEARQMILITGGL
jgi:adenylyl-sulfate kinase